MIEETHAVPHRMVPDAVVDSILAAVANGKPLFQACEQAGVARTSFYRWLDSDPALVSAYAQAVAAQVHSRFTK
ncbi:helix-turn-helix domain-containing protein [Paraburkholderia sp. GAS348]|uniref:helix-turn-helix domain-containing protein n=1 Tax=Paraburkholderia sp. GAS348 TaxID=3035132 RepID=UPI003D1CE853